MERLFIIFQQTALQFSNAIKNICRVIFGLYVSLAFILGFKFADGTYHSDINHCSSNVPFYSIAFSGISEYILSLVISATFARKLLTLNLTTVDNEMRDIMRKASSPRAHMKVHPGHGQFVNSVSTTFEIKGMKFGIDEQDATYKVLTKSTLLTFIALLSTQLQLLVTGLIGLRGMLSCIDTVINGWCVMLMFARYSHIYDKFGCMKMEKCVTIKCLSCYSCNYCCLALDVKNIGENINEEKDGKESEDIQVQNENDDGHIKVIPKPMSAKIMEDEMENVLSESEGESDDLVEEILQQDQDEDPLDDESEQHENGVNEEKITSIQFTGQQSTAL